MALIVRTAKGLYQARWNYYYKFKNFILKNIHTHKYLFKLMRLLSFLVPIVLVLYYIYPAINNFLRIYFSIESRIEKLSSVLLTLGGSMVGVTIIAFTFIIFAMQVNVERLPYGLFRKFSSDKYLLSLFIGSLVFAVITLFSSIVVSEANITDIAYLVIFSNVMNVTLILKAYQRSLDLTSPYKQLSILFEATKRNFRHWLKVADNWEKRAAEFYNPSIYSSTVLRIHYFSEFPWWAGNAKKNLYYAFSVARYYSLQGDYEVSQKAFEWIVEINKCYILTKGKIFFPKASDDFINVTLESVRQFVDIAVSRSDEQQIILALLGFRNLCLCYLDNIAYESSKLETYYARITAGYLVDALKLIVPHKMDDVLRSGLSYFEKIIPGIISDGNIYYINTVSSDILTIAVDRNSFPVSYIAIGQLDKLIVLLEGSNEIGSGDILAKIKLDKRKLDELMGS